MRYVIYQTIIKIAIMVLLVLLLALQSIVAFGGSGTNIVILANRQIARSLVIERDIGIYAYTAGDDNKARALSELQIAVPRWEKTQKDLSSGNESLGLPSYMPANINVLLTSSQVDFVPIDTTIRKVMVTPAKLVTQIDVDIVRNHEIGYTTTMSLLTTAWQDRIDSNFYSAFYTEAGITLFTLILAFIDNSLFNRALRLIAPAQMTVIYAALGGKKDA